MARMHRTKYLQLSLSDLWDIPNSPQPFACARV